MDGFDKLYIGDGKISLMNVSGHTNDRDSLNDAYFIFAVEGFSKVVQDTLIHDPVWATLSTFKPALFDKCRMVIPECIDGGEIDYRLDSDKIMVGDTSLRDIIGSPEVTLRITVEDIFDMGCDLRKMYITECGDLDGLKYIRPQAIEFKGIVGISGADIGVMMSQYRCKRNVEEMRIFVNKLYDAASASFPKMMEPKAHCERHGYCPNVSDQHEKCKGKIPAIDIRSL